MEQVALVAFADTFDDKVKLAFGRIAISGPRFVQLIVRMNESFAVGDTIVDE